MSLETQLLRNLMLQYAGIKPKEGKSYPHPVANGLGGFINLTRPDGPNLNKQIARKTYPITDLGGLRKAHEAGVALARELKLEIEEKDWKIYFGDMPEFIDK